MGRLDGHRMSPPVALFGASGAAGRALVAEAGRRGIGVRALVRGEAEIPGVTVIRGDARDPRAVSETVAGSGAIVCLLGPRPGDPADACSVATGRIVSAARDLGVRRLVIVTGAMIGAPSASLSWIYRLIRRALPADQRASLADRREQERIARESGLDWTIVRPPRLTSGRPAGATAWAEDLPVPAWARLDRADLAAFLLAAIPDGRLIGRAVTVRSVGTRRA